MEPDRPLASVIVPCKGHAIELRRCLRSLECQQADFPFETLVVDSASDPAVMAAGEEFPDVRFIRGDRNLLAGPARNLGVREARGEYIAFIDADCQADPGWLTSAARALGGEAAAELVGGPVLDARPWHPVAVTDNILQFADFLPGRPEGPARYFPGCNMAVRRTVFLAAGGFSDDNVIAGEDTKFSEQVRARWPRGLQFVQEMTIRHDGRKRAIDFLRHQSSFGYVRAILGLHLSPFQQRWGRRRAALPAVVGKRLVYIVRRNLAWGLPRSPRLVLLFPMIVAGLTTWAVGFRRGCYENHRRRSATRRAGHREKESLQ